MPGVARSRGVGGRREHRAQRARGSAGARARGSAGRTHVHLRPHGPDVLAPQDQHFELLVGAQRARELRGAAVADLGPAVHLQHHLLVSAQRLERRRQRIVHRVLRHTARRGPRRSDPVVRPASPRVCDTP